MATYNETGSGAVGLGGTSPVVYEANVTGSGGVRLVSRSLNSQHARRVEREGPTVALLVGGTVSVSLDRNPVPE